MPTEGAVVPRTALTPQRRTIVLGHYSVLAASQQSEPWRSFWLLFGTWGEVFLWNGASTRTVLLLDFGGLI